MDLHYITVNSLRLDSERRSVAHYLAWIGDDDSLADILSTVPAFSSLQDMYGETPLMLAVRSDCYKIIIILGSWNKNISAEVAGPACLR